MTKDTLFLLPPGFEDNGRREYCPECAEIWGLLGYYPFVRDALDVVHVGIAHPRAAIVDLLGDGRHNAPTLVLAEGSEVPPGVPVREVQGRLYLESAGGIAALFSARYGTAARRGS